MVPPFQPGTRNTKHGWEEEFDAEKAAHAKLRPLQGIVIPEYLGELDYGIARAHLLSDEGGASLATPEVALVEATEMERMLRQAMLALSELGVLQGDTKLDNFHVDGDKIMVLDLERLDGGGMSRDELLSMVECEVEELMRRYESTQDALWNSGTITVDVKV